MFYVTIMRNRYCIMHIESCQMHWKCYIHDFDMEHLFMVHYMDDACDLFMPMRLIFLQGYIYDRSLFHSDVHSQAQSQLLQWDGICLEKLQVYELHIKWARYFGYLLLLWNDQNQERCIRMSAEFNLIRWWNIIFIVISDTIDTE